MLLSNVENSGEQDKERSNARFSMSSETEKTQPSAEQDKQRSQCNKQRDSTWSSLVRHLDTILTSCKATNMPTHNLHSRMNKFLQRREEIRMTREECGSNSRTNTLQSVLRGEVPSEYLHLTTFSDEQNRPTYVSSVIDSDHQMIQSRRHQPIRNSDSIYTIPMQSDSHDVIFRQGNSPGTQRRMSPYERPTHGTPAGYRGHQGDGSPSEQYYDRRSPVYHNNRASPFYEPGSPFRRQGSSPHYIQHASPARPQSPQTSYSPVLAPNSPVSAHSPYPSSDEVFIEDEQPIDLSCKPEKSPSSQELVFSSIQDTHDSQSNRSLLRNLLSSGKQVTCGNPDGDSSCSDVMKPEVPVTGTTPVTLAKKMIHPITSRVSDWLVKIVQFSKSIPEFSNMSSNDKLTLLSNSWARILILFMAENEFEFAVTPLQSAEGQSADNSNMDECPTMKSVETIQSFIRKCKNMNLDQKEYALLRMSVLFNSGHVGLDNPEMVEKLNAAVQQLLQQHVTTTRPGEAMHYSRILLCLPTLYGMNSKMIENLFCHGIHPNMDIELLLLEMLRNL